LSISIPPEKFCIILVYTPLKKNKRKTGKVPKKKKESLKEFLKIIAMQNRA